MSSVPIYTAEGEEDEEEVLSDDSDGPRPALPVTEDGGESGEEDADADQAAAAAPPATAEEYLRRVRREAKGIPDVLVSDVDARTYDHLQTVSCPDLPTRPLPAYVRPRRAWRRRVQDQFAAIREGLAAAPCTAAVRARRDQLPRERSAEVWQGYLYGGGGTPPTTSLVLALDQIRVRRLLALHARWLDASSAHSGGGVPLSRARAAWIYALLARLQHPLLPETGVDLSSLASSLRGVQEAWAEAEIGAGAPSAGSLEAANLLLAVLDSAFAVRPTRGRSA